MTQYASSDQFQLRGDWFLPTIGGVPPFKVAGELAWGEGGASLVLHGGLVDIGSPILAASDATIHPVLWGETTAEGAVTLLDVVLSRSRHVFNATFRGQEQTLRSTLFVVGAHVDTDTRYKQMRYRVPGLDGWLNAGGATMRQQLEPSRGVVYEFDNSWFEEVVVPANRLRLRLVVERVFPSVFNAEVTIKTDGWLEVLPDTPQTLGLLMREGGIAAALLSLHSGALMQPDRIEVQCEDEVSAQVLVRPNQPHHARISRHGFFMLRTVLGGPDFTNVAQRWFALHAVAEQPIALAHSVLNSSALWTHIEFLSLMQALEGLHRALLPGEYVPPEEYQQIAAHITSAIPTRVGKEHRDALKARIKYGNEFSLRKRLKALVAPYQRSCVSTS